MRPAPVTTVAAATLALACRPRHRDRRGPDARGARDADPEQPARHVAGLRGRDRPAAPDPRNREAAATSRSWRRTGARTSTTTPTRPTPTGSRGRWATGPSHPPCSPASAARSCSTRRGGSSRSASASTGRCWRCSTRTRSRRSRRCRCRPAPSRRNPFTDFSGGGYFYLDHRDRAVVSTNERHLLVIGITPGPGFAVVRDYDVIERRSPRATRSSPRSPTGAAASGSSPAAAGSGRSTAAAGPCASSSSPARASRTPSPSTRPAASSSSPTRRCTASTPPAMGGPKLTWRRAYADLRGPEAGAERRRLRHHADADGSALGRDHRQRRPDEHRRLQAQEGQQGPPRLPQGRFRSRRRRHRPVADRRRQLAGRREQLRLHGPSLGRAGRHHRARPGPRGRAQAQEQEQAGRCSAAARSGPARSARPRWCRRSRSRTASSTPTPSRAGPRRTPGI